MLGPDHATTRNSQIVHLSGRAQSASPSESSVPGCSPAVQEPRDPSPKILKGSVHAQCVKCGKPGCRCSRGHLHGPYFYWFWREDRRFHKEYVASANLMDVLKAIAAGRTMERRIRESWRLVRMARAQIREIEDSISEGRQSG